MTSSQKISALAEKAIEWRKKVGEGLWPGESFWPTDIEFIAAASPEAWLALRNEVLEEVKQACEERARAYREIKAPGWQDVDHECAQCIAAIEALKHQRPA